MYTFWDMILTDGMEVDPSKVEDVMNWDRWKIVSDIRSFLGLTGYYRRFIQVFTIALSLTHLTRKNIPFKWDDAYECDF